jgi:maleylacetoacetate isomerase
MSVTLYDYWRSSASYRLRIALGLLGQDYNAVAVDLSTGAHHAPEHLARNPQGLIPALELDGHNFTQSLAIIEYLDETRNAGFLPKSPLERARVRRISYAIAMEIHAVCNLSVAKFASDNSGGNITMSGWMQAFIPRGLEAVEVMLAEAETGKFCHGDSVTMVDICLVPQIYNARRWQVKMAATPTIDRIMDALEKVDAVAAAHPDKHNPDA